jgi:hypothetical protein
VKISEMLMQHVEKLQAKSDSSFERYPTDDCVLPNDAIAPMRSLNFSQVCELIETLVEQSGKPLSVVMEKSIKPNASEIAERFPYTSNALNAIIRDFGANATVAAK